MKTVIDHLDKILMGLVGAMFLAAYLFFKFLALRRRFNNRLLLAAEDWKATEVVELLEKRLKLVSQNYHVGTWTISRPELLGRFSPKAIAGAFETWLYFLPEGEQPQAIEELALAVCRTYNANEIEEFSSGLSRHSEIKMLWLGKLKSAQLAEGTRKREAEATAKEEREKRRRAEKEKTRQRSELKKRFQRRLLIDLVKILNLI